MALSAVRVSPKVPGFQRSMFDQETEKKGGEVYSELLHSELMWAEVGHAFLR